MGIIPVHGMRVIWYQLQSASVSKTNRDDRVLAMCW